MGSRSKSRSSNTSGQTQNGDEPASWRQWAISNSSMMDMLSQMHGPVRWGRCSHLFDAMVQNGTSMPRAATP